MLSKEHGMSGAKRRLNLLIDAELLDRLKEVARQKDLSASWLIRKGVELLLETAAVESKPSRQKGKAASKRRSPLDDPILKVIGLLEGPTLSSRAIDGDLYKTKLR
jgi:hypothetical protein